MLLVSLLLLVLLLLPTRRRVLISPWLSVIKAHGRLTIVGRRLTNADVSRLWRMLTLCCLSRLVVAVCIDVVACQAARQPVSLLAIIVALLSQPHSTAVSRQQPVSPCQPLPALAPILSCTFCAFPVVYFICLLCHSAAFSLISLTIFVAFMTFGF